MEINKAFLITLRSFKSGYPRLYRIFTAWACHESNYGNNVLGKSANNWHSLKYRDLSPYMPHDVWERVGVVDYIDWSGHADRYLKIYDPADYPEIFRAFLKRPPYTKATHTTGTMVLVTPTLLEKHPLCFLSWVAENGFCGSTPGVERKDYKTDREFADAVQAAYVYGILRVYHSKKFKDLMEEVENGN